MSSLCDHLPNTAQPLQLGQGLAVCSQAEGILLKIVLLCPGAERRTPGESVSLLPAGNRGRRAGPGLPVSQGGEAATLCLPWDPRNPLPF